MYQVMKNGEIIAFVDSPRFICKSKSGCFIQTSEENANGIVLNGTTYNLLGREPMEDVDDFVGYSEVNGGEYIFHQQSAIDEVIQTILEG